MHKFDIRALQWLKGNNSFPQSFGLLFSGSSGTLGLERSRNHDVQIQREPSCDLRVCSLKKKTIALLSILRLLVILYEVEKVF